MYVSVYICVVAICVIRDSKFHCTENYRVYFYIYCWSWCFNLLSSFIFWSAVSQFFHFFQTVSREQSLLFKIFWKGWSWEANLPACFCGNLVSVFFVSLAQRHILTSDYGMQHEGVSGSEVGVQRVYTKSTSTDVLLLVGDLGSGSSFHKEWRQVSDSVIISTYIIQCNQCDWTLSIF